MDLGFTGAHVCVQGGSAGMGRAAAEAFAREGARVAIIGRLPERLAETAERLRALGSPEVITAAADIGDTASVSAAFATIAAAWPHLNAVVNAAGPQTSGQAWHEIDDAKWLDSFSIGALGAMRCARAALPLLRAAEWARIVNLSAMSTQHHSRGLADYTAAKAALISISKNMALELAPEGILVNMVSPGPVMSANLRSYISAGSEGAVDPDDLVASGQWLKSKFGSSTDLGRVAHPDEIAPAILLAASRVSSFMTGANTNVDGGSHFQ
ncbi:SDR family NAD(P)-dependent oxidoreductase [Sphingomonas sp. 67-41]|jgi:NAD(P)-dependent dehydrogenase (short-subunit alcohol dehydrogenase family)|uniref:SDR family NAD(P)-dependent oxidoreductase n=1 Tax=Sphingomonas TaxID=13687 RepID=UPI00095DAE4F|nr:SDR family oxidoreductase [Sphingomonas sp. 67-41]OJY53882.1 MAG: short-chain dehydrogenase [Sphingomonas sp. 67-41]